MQFIVLLKFSPRVGDPYDFINSLRAAEQTGLVARVDHHYNVVVEYSAASREAVQNYFDDIEGLQQVDILEVIPEVNTPATQPVAMKASSPQLITSQDIPGPRPAMRASAVVHRDISSPAGLASFVGTGAAGFGIGGLDQLGQLSDS